MTEDAQAVEECRRRLEEMVDVDCRSGAYDEADIVEAIAEILEGELEAPHPELLRELTERARAGLAAHEQAERTWHGRTVNDGIESAFAALADRGFVAAETLGSTVQEGWARAEALAADLPRARACVFFHRQDLERAVRGEGLLLAFGPLRLGSPGAAGPEPAEGDAPRGPQELREQSPSRGMVRLGIQRADANPIAHTNGDVEEATRAIGREIVAVLTHYGVDTVWDGSARVRIAIPAFAWQRRRLTAAPPSQPPPPLEDDLGASPPKPPAPAACPDCNGRGWLPPLQEGWGADLCWCQGGKRRAAVPDTAAPTPPAAESPPERGVLAWLKRRLS